MEKYDYSQWVSDLIRPGVIDANSQPDMPNFILQRETNAIKFWAANPMTLEQVVNELKELKVKFCGFAHSDPDSDYGCSDCPDRVGNLVCGHLDDFWTGEFLRSVVWLVNKLNKEGERFNQEYRDLLVVMDELMRINIGAESGLGVPIRTEMVARNVHPELVDFGVLRTPRRLESGRPSKESVREKLIEMQGKIGSRITGIRDKLQRVLECLVE